MQERDPGASSTPYVICNVRTKIKGFPPLALIIRGTHARILRFSALEMMLGGLVADASWEEGGVGGRESNTDSGVSAMQGKCKDNH